MVRILGSTGDKVYRIFSTTGTGGWVPFAGVKVIADSHESAILKFKKAYKTDKNRRYKARLN